MTRYSIRLSIICFVLYGVCAVACVGPRFQQSASAVPDLRAQTIIDALKQWPGWSDDTRQGVVLTGRNAGLIGDGPASATVESGWTDAQAKMYLLRILPNVPAGGIISLEPSVLPRAGRRVSRYVYNPVIVNNFALIQADQPYTGSYVHIFEWRGAWIPVAVVLGPAF